MNYLLDTNVISELVAKRPNEKVIDWIRGMDEERLYLSVIALGEIKKGIEKLPFSDRKAELDAWLSDDLLARFRGRLVALDVNVLLEWGKLTARLELAGKKMPVIDALIAASAICGDFTLATRNVADFADTGVQIINPWN